MGLVLNLISQESNLYRQLLYSFYRGTGSPQKKMLDCKTNKKNAIGATIRIGRESECFPYTGFFGQFCSFILLQKRHVKIIWSCWQTKWLYH